jgi:hypothetical protein
MAVSIGELQMETQQPSAPAAAPGYAAQSGGSSGELDLRCAMESLRERQLRLEAD